MKRVTTKIASNGSKSLGGKPDSIAKLLEVLDEYPLDRVFERFGNFASNVEGRPGYVSFFGNFHTLSHVFNITTNDPKVCGKLTAAIKKNKKRADYLSQPNVAEQLRIERARAEANMRAIKERGR